MQVEVDGKRRLLDIGALLGVPTDAVIECFDVEQASDLTVYLALSVKLDERESTLWVVKPFELDATISLAALPTQTTGRIHRIVMVSRVCFPSQAYPVGSLRGRRLSLSRCLSHASASGPHSEKLRCRADPGVPGQ